MGKQLLIKKLISNGINPPNYYKLNTNGSFEKSLNRGGIGGIIRNATGNWIIGFVKKNLCY